MLKIVLDTNILVSALNFGGKPLDVLQLSRHRAVELYLSRFIFEETAKVLGKKFRWNEQDITKAFSSIHQYCTMVSPKKLITIIQRKDSDNRILECAEAAEADYIVTGDTIDLQPLKKYGKTRIVSPSQFLGMWVDL